jgi:excisionase family DNA binding protein
MKSKPKFTIHVITQADPDDEYRGYAILPNDVTRGYEIGDIEQVKQLAARLNSFLKTKRDDGAIDHLAEEIGWQWLDIADALPLSRDVGVPIAAPTIRKACAEGRIGYAKLDGKTWRFPRATFLGWLKRSPHKRGRRTKKHPAA